MMNRRRTFIAIDISEHARREIEGHIERLRRAHRQAKIGWERPEKLHVTLKFLGETEESKLDTLKNVITDVASGFGPFRLRLTTTGAFPSGTKPRVLWVGLSAASDVLSRFYDEIDRACTLAGFSSETRAFRPHVTIGRIRQQTRPVADLVGDHLARAIEPVEFDVQEVVLYESKLQPTGSVYSVIARAPFSNG